MNNKKPQKTYIYSSTFGKIIEQFVIEKRNLGFKYGSEAKRLANFDRFLSGQKCDGYTLPREVVEEYTAKTSYESIRNHQARYILTRQLCKYMNLNGYNAYISPQLLSFKRKGDFIPYIFSQDEIKQLFISADQFSYCNKSPHRHIVVPMILRLLYCCGLRCSEVLNLKISDVDLNRGVLYIRNSKFGKDRLVPMSESLTMYIRRYMDQVHSTVKSNDTFLPSPRLREYVTGVAYANYRRVLFTAGISHGGKGKGPRLHDLRHTFAVHCLKQWVMSGVDIGAALPYLSAYMGHTNIQSTQQYLRLTAEVYPLITSAVEKYCEDVIPELGGELNGRY